MLNLVCCAKNKQIFLCSVLFVESSDVIAAMEALQPPQQENEEPHMDADVQEKGQDDNPEISFNVLFSQSEEGEKEGNAAVAPTSIDSIQFSTEPPVTLQVYSGAAKGSRKKSSFYDGPLRPYKATPHPSSLVVTFFRNLF